MNKYSEKPHILLFALLGVALYWYTLSYPFVFDSRFYLVNNPLITDGVSFLKLLDLTDFADDYVKLNIHRDVLVTFILRPFTNFTFYLNYLFDGFDPESYRVVNIAIHILNSMLWYVLLTKIIRYRSGNEIHENQWFVPFFSALLFLVHPLGTESVTYIIQRYASLGCFFYLTTMLLFVVSILNPVKWHQRLAYIGSLITLLVGMHAKENLVTAPLALVLLGTVLLRLPLRRVLILASVHMCCMPVIPLLVYLVYRIQAEADRSLYTISSFVVAYPTYEYVLTQARVILTFFRMLVAPYGQNIDPSYPLYRSVADPEIIVSLIMILLFVFTAIVLQRKKNRQLNDDLISFCIVFSLLSISLSSFFPLPDLMTEHRSYLFSLPVITGLVCRFDSIRNQLTPVWATRVIVFLFLMAVLYSVLTVKRNLLYSSPSALWEDSVSKSPAKWRPNYNAGVAAVEEQKYPKALNFFQQSIQANPYKLEGYANLGSTYLTLGNYHSAIDAYMAGLAVGGDDPVLLVNLGNAYRQAGQLRDAIEVLEQAVHVNHGLSEPYRMLAELYAELGQRDKALRSVRKARELDAVDSGLVSLEEEILKLK